jgi:hypothetical protein
VDKSQQREKVGSPHESLVVVGRVYDTIQPPTNKENPKPQNPKTPFI